MDMVTAILGNRSDPALAAALHRLEHAGAVEFVDVAPADLPRRRLRAVTDRGTQVAIALSRAERLFDGAVLVLTDSRAVVVRLEADRWLRVAPVDGPSALALGYTAGNLHWRVRFDGADLLVALEREEGVYRDRLTDLTADGRVAILSVETGTGGKVPSPSNHDDAHDHHDSQDGQNAHDKHPHLRREPAHAAGDGRPA